MTVNVREVKEGLISQGIDEAWRYTIDTAPVSGTATGTPTLVAWDEKDGSIVTSTITTGSLSLAGTIITTSIIQNLRQNATYKIRVSWSVGSGQTRSRFFRVRGEL